MGADQSSLDKRVQQQLTPQSVPICATESRFCVPHTVQLDLGRRSFSWSGYDFKVTDAFDFNIIHFQCEGLVFSMREKKILKDNVGEPVLNIKRKIFSYNDFTVFAGERSKRIISKFSTHFTFLRIKQYATFRDALNGEIRHFVLKGNNNGGNRYMIFLGEPKQGGILIARIFRRKNCLSSSGMGEYIMEIAANVDVAICVIMCIALNEAIKPRPLPVQS